MKYSFVRWVVVTMISIVTIICFIERQAFAVLWPFISADLFPEDSPQEMKETYASISALFVFSGIFGYLISGRVFDWVGTRIGFALLMILYGLVTIAYAFSNSVFSLGLTRMLQGISDSGTFPGAIKANAEIFSSQESAFGMSLINIGNSIAGLIAISFIAYLSLSFSWQTIFILLGLSSLILFIPLMILLKSKSKQSKLSDEESGDILDNEHNLSEAVHKQSAQSIWQVLSHKQSWGIIIVYAALKPIWLLCIMWLPLYFIEVHEMDYNQIVVNGWKPYAGALLGDLAGGILAFILMKAGWTLNKARKFIISFGCLVLFLSLIAIMMDSKFFYISIAMFGLTFALCNVQTLPRDFFESEVLGRLSGVMLFVAGIMSVITTTLVPWLSYGGDYTNVFILALVSVLVAIVSFWLLCPKIESLQSDKQGLKALLRIPNE